MAARPLIHLPLLLHPHTEPAGWRWAVQATSPRMATTDPTVAIVNAGWCATRQEADHVGQLVLYSCGSLFDLLGVAKEMGPAELDHDPFAGRSLVAEQRSPTTVVLAVEGTD